jgi:hypothetical protein
MSVERRDPDGGGFTKENAWKWLNLAVDDLVEIHGLAEEALEALDRKNFARVRRNLKKLRSLRIYGLNNPCENTNSRAVR